MSKTDQAVTREGAAKRALSRDPSSHTARQLLLAQADLSDLYGKPQKALQLRTLADDQAYVLAVADWTRAGQLMATRCEQLIGRKIV